MKRRIRTYAQATEPAGTGLVAQINAQADRLHARFGAIRNTIVVGSGKGGVGKSFVAALVATALAKRGYTVGALDADINGPSLPRMLGVMRAPLRVDAKGVHPAQSRAGCTVMSTDLLLESPDAPLRWREPDSGGYVWQSALETGMLREFMSDVYWGDLDALVIDLPPGTDKIARILPLLPRISAMLVVTTPSGVASAAVARSLTQLHEAGITNIALVSNMDGYVCPACRTVAPLFATASSVPSVADTARDEPRVAIPFDPRAAAATDAGDEIPPDSPVSNAVDRLIEHLDAIVPLRDNPFDDNQPAPEGRP